MEPDFTIVDLTINILCLGKLYGAKSRFNNRTPVQQYSLYNDGNLAIQSQHFSPYNDIINITNDKSQNHCKNVDGHDVMLGLLHL